MSERDAADLIVKCYVEGAKRSQQFSELDKYYVLWPGEKFGHATYLVRFYSERLFLNDPRFAGFLCHAGAEDSLGQFSELPIISAAEFVGRRQNGERLGLLSFCSTPEELAFFAPLKSDTFSYVCGLHASNVNHTYVSIEEERRFILENMGRYIAILANFEDFTSKRMLFGRMQAILSMDMDHIINNYYDTPLEYFNRDSPEFSFMLRDTEILCDVGASWGDCVTKFSEMVPDLQGSYIYAFEPNAGEFEKLKTLEDRLPLKADNAIVSNVTGGGYFLTDEANLHGSQLAAEGSEADQRRTVRLDDVCERATFIKIDAEGAEPDILQGAMRLLSAPDCRLASCIYHYPADMFKTIDIMESVGRRRFFFRQHHPSLWDGIIYFN